MKRLCVFGVATFLLTSGIQARLVPKNFCDDPPVQRLTATVTGELWHTDAFGQCKGISVRPLSRVSNPQVKYYLWAVADEACNGVVYGVEREEQGQREVDTVARFGSRGQGNGQFLHPASVAVDTSLYNSGTQYFYVYVADSRNGRVVRCRFNWSTKSLSYDDTLNLNLVNPVDVDCVTKQDSGGAALLAVLDGTMCRVTILRVKSDLSTEVLATLGTKGSGTGQFRHPTGLCISPRNDGGYYVYVADQWNSRIVALVLNKTGSEWQMTWATEWRDESHSAGFEDVATSAPYGYVYATARFANAIYVFRSNLAELLYIRSGGVEFPLNLSSLGDEMAMTESWTAQSGIQYFRIVPGIGITCQHSLFDATKESLCFSVRIEELTGYADISIVDGNTVIRHLFADTSLNEGTYYDFSWDGHTDAGGLALPGYYALRVSASYKRGETDPDLITTQSSTIRVKGTKVPNAISSNTTWDTLHAPYVLSDHSLDINHIAGSATLTIQPGVRVMFADSGVSRSIITHSADRIVANGTSQDSIYFMPYRKMAEPYTPAKRGWWGSISLGDGSNGGQFSYCVFENGGNCDSATVIDVRQLNSGALADFGHCRFSGSSGHALRPFNQYGRDKFDIDTCAFEYCASYPVYNVRAMDVAGICASCTFANNDVAGLFVHNDGDVAERMTSSCTWPCMSPGWHYDLDGDLIFKSATGGYPVFTIGAGASIRMPTYGVIQVGYHDGASNDKGAIVANGLPGSPIVFEGLNGAIWNGVWLDWDPSNYSSFKYCTFKDGTGYSRVSTGGVQYYPLLYCEDVSPVVYRSKFLNATRTGNDRGTGVFLNRARSRVSQCKFIKDECGILANFSSVLCCTTAYCQIDSGQMGFFVYTPGAAAGYLRHSNVFGNTEFGASNLDAAHPLNANSNWWGPNGTGQNRGRPGWLGNNGVNSWVIATAWDTLPFSIWSMDAQAVSILTPVGWHVPGAVVPRAVVRNHLDTTVTFTARLGIGTVYLQSVEETLAANAVDTVDFPQATLDSGRYNLGLKVSLAGDENPANDSTSDTVWVRDSVDAAAVAVLAPPAQITVDDTIAPRVSIANYGAIARQIPVKYYLNSTYVETKSVLVAAHETAEVSLDARTYRPGTHEVMFVANLPLDDDRTNDTARASVHVKAGDYWVAQDSPPYANARLCWDRNQYVYAAERAGSGVSRYNTLANDWSSVSVPGVEAIFGITSLKGQVYVLGNASSYTLDASRQTANRLERQAATTQGQSRKDKGLSKAGNAEGDAQGAAGVELGGFSNDLSIYRYVATGDSWVLVTTCDSTLVPGNASNLVADEAGSIYLIEGGTNRIRRYIMAADSWVSSTASYVINRWGAAAWGRGKLYVLAGPTRVLALDPATGQWNTVSLTSPDTSYGTALCADPVMDRLFAFCHRWDGGPSQVSPFREKSLRTLAAGWNVRAVGVADTTGTALCFGSTQAYCLDGHGGFWRYRPTPLFDAAAVAEAIPDTIPLDSVIVPAGVVQNTGQDTVQFSVHMTIGAYDSTRTDTVPPQQWDTVAFNARSFPAGTHPIRLTVSLGGESSHYNDTATGTLFVRYRTDAEALAVESPVGRIPYDNLISPAGRVGSNSDSTLSVWVRMTIGTGYTESLLVALPPEGESTVTFDTCHLRLGEYTAVLRVRCTGDEVPGNDAESVSVQIVAGDYWKVLAQCPDDEVRLVGSPGSDVYSAKRSGTNFRHYNAAQDTWESKAASSLGSNLSLCRQGNKIYALGSLSFADGLDAASSPGLGQQPKSPADFSHDPRDDRAQTGVVPVRGLSKVGMGQTDGPPAIAGYDVNSNVWSTVASPLPFSAGNGSCLFAADDTTLFVLRDLNNGLWRYSITQHTWLQMASMPGSVSAWTSGAYDNAGHFYVLTDPTGKLREYIVAGDSWDSLTPLNGSTPTGSALCCDADQNRLYAFWAGTGPGAYCYDIAEQAWTEVESFPSGLALPALAQCGDNPYGQNDSTFAMYVPEPVLDVAALEILVPGDTERYDSAVVPTGVVHNLSEVPVWCQVTLTLGDMVPVVQPLYMEPDQTDTVAFVSTYLPAGLITATLHVTCTGDANPGNDTCSKPVQVDAPWEPRDQSNYAQGRLDADSGTSVYFAPRNSGALQEYSISEDIWSGVLLPPLASYCYDLAYYGGALYALGLVGQDGALKGGRKLGMDAGPNLPTHPAIYRYTLGDSIWTLLTDSLPTTQVGSGTWIAATGSGIYLEPGWGRAFFRHDSSQGWTTMDSLPVTVTSPVALDWDRDDEVFLLGAVSAIGSTFLGYSISGDSWVTLATIPVQPETGMAIAAEPGGNTVLALMPADTGHALLYAYDRTQDTWTLMTSPTWAAGDGAAMTWAGSEAYALTGYQTTQPSWFWCYDPGFAAYWGRSLEGVAGKALTLLRWQLTCTPNPLSARAVIRWQVPRLSSVSLKVYNTAGQMVRLLSQGSAKPGSYTATWNGCDQKGRRLAAGVYVCALDGPGARITRKVVLTQ